MEKSNPIGPAEELRTVATLIRESASNATPGPWQVASGETVGLGIEQHGPGSYSYDVELAYVTSSAQRKEDLSHDPSIKVGTQAADAAWIALMSPDKAEHLFRWLADAANDMAGAEVVGSKLPDAADPIEYCDEPDSVRAALAFARSILGRTS